MRLDAAVILDFAGNIQIAVVKRLGLFRHGGKGGQSGAGGPSFRGVIGGDAGESHVAEAIPAFRPLDNLSSLRRHAKGERLDKDLARQAVVGASEAEKVLEDDAEVELQRPHGAVRVAFARETGTDQRFLPFDQFTNTADLPRHFGIVQGGRAFELRQRLWRRRRR